MKTVAVLFGIAQCLAVIAPTHAAPNPEHEHHNNGLKNRLKRQYSDDYGFGHHQWPRRHYEPRRDDAQDLLSKVYRLLEDLTELQRRPPPPPQPIYIPYPVAYPVQYPVPVYRNCQGYPTQNLTFPSRFPIMEDSNQNWGYDLSQETPEDYSKNTRPINFDRVTPPTYTTRPPLKFDHGTSQADINSKNPREGSERRPKKCDAMVLSCCNPNESRQQQHRCFTLEGCGEYYEKDDVCSAEKLQEVLDLFASVYSPK